MPRHRSADALGGLQHRVVVVAQRSAALDALMLQLKQRNCAVERAETLAEAQSMLVREAPHIAFIECRPYPRHVPDIAALFRESNGMRPRLIGIGREHKPAEDPRACGLDDYLRLPPEESDLEALFALRSGDDAAVRGDTNVLPLGCRELSASDTIVELPQDVQTAMLTAFVEYTAICFERIDAGLQTHDLGQVMRDVHAVKSGCLQLGFTTMAECCEEMRRAIDANDLSTARVCHRALLATFNAIVNELPRN